MIFSGLEKFGFVLLFCTPDEFYVSFVKTNEPIKVSSINNINKSPTKNEVLANSKFVIEYNSEYVLCQIKEDLKYDEIFCQILLCNSDLTLKVHYEKLIVLNTEDIINNENSTSLKFHDFSPLFPDEWSSNLILKLKELMNYKKLIFLFKSFMVDPSDGRYPVEVLNLIDRKSLNELFINESLAMKSIDYFKSKLERSVIQVLNDKKIKNAFFKVSVPLAKNKPKSRAKIASAKSLNASAQIFIPTKNHNLNKLTPISNEENHENCLSSNLKPGETKLNIVNMFSEMYQNRQNKINQSSTMPFSNYQSVFPLYGGVNFSKNILVTSTDTCKQNQTRILQSTATERADLIEKSLNSSLPSKEFTHSSLLNETSQLVDVSKINTLKFSDNFESTASSFVSSVSPEYYKTDLNKLENFEMSSNSAISLSDNNLNTAQFLSEIEIPSCIPQEDLKNNPDLIVPIFSNLSIQASSLESKIYASSPIISNLDTGFYKTPSGNCSTLPGDLNCFRKGPFLPDIEYMRHNPAPEYYFKNSSIPNFQVRSDCIFTFNPNLPPPTEPIAILNNNLLKPIYVSEKKVDETVKLISDKPVNTVIPESVWIQVPRQFIQPASQTGLIHIKPVNLIYYHPN